MHVVPGFCCVGRTTSLAYFVRGLQDSEGIVSKVKVAEYDLTVAKEVNQRVK